MDLPSLPKPLQFGYLYLVANLGGLSAAHHFSSRLRDLNLSAIKRLDISNELRPLLINSISTPNFAFDPDAQGVELRMRRFNVGNLGNEHTTTLRLGYEPKRINIETMICALTDFWNKVLDITNPSTGDEMLDINLYTADFCFGEESWDDWVDVQFEEDIVESNSLPLPKLAPAGAGADIKADYVEREVRCRRPGRRAQKTPESRAEDKIIDELIDERNKVLKELQAAVYRYITTYHEDPTEMVQEWTRGKFFWGNNGLSPIVVNGEFKIILTGFNEVEVKMPALCRSIYILFLVHNQEGIVLKYIRDYRQELEEIYSMVMPGRDEVQATNAINNLCNPCNPTLHEYLSKIKRCLSSVILNEEIAAHYHIRGKRGCPYRIDLPQELITLPAILKR